MYYSMRVVTLLALLVPLVHCFSWDIVVGIEKRLEFYYNGILTHTEDIPSARDIKSTTYDPVKYRIIFADNNFPNVSISSFDLSTRQIEQLVTGMTTRESVRVVYEPVKELLFWKSGYSIYSFPLKPASSNKTIAAREIATTEMYCLDIAVDSCGGYIYWVTDTEVERARFDGSKRLTLIKNHVFWRLSLAIDQRTKTMYWIEQISKLGVYQTYIVSANLHGEKTIYVLKNETSANSLAVSKDFMYWRGDDEHKIWQLPKNPREDVEPNLYSVYKSRSCFDCQHIAAHYTIKEQTQGIPNCESLKRLIPISSEPGSTDDSNVTAVRAETREQCKFSTCDNYCIQGDCSVNAEGQQICSCNAGYSGKRCELNACHKHCLNNGVCSLNEEDEPVCECKEGYQGERCEVSEACSGSEGEPNSSCTEGACKLNACHDYCFNNGVCALNEENKPVCQCAAGFDGERCDVPVVVMKCMQCVTMLTNMLNTAAAPVTLAKAESASESTVV